MPLNDKRKGLFSDLGRPTRRGVKKCPKCGTVNGTRGNSCKNKSCDVIFRADNGSKKKPTTDACRIFVPNGAAEIYSVRLRDRGPDYRSFVQLTPTPPTPTAGDAAGYHLPQGTFPKCFVSACNRNRVQCPCTHIKSAQKCFTTSQRVLIRHSMVDTLQIPAECKQILSTFVTELPDGQYVQRCSKTSFVVRCTPSTRHPLGYLHVLFFKPSKEDGGVVVGTIPTPTEPKFLCTCRPFKIPNNETETPENGGGNTPAPPAATTKLCIHFYSCLLAFASNEELATEFEYYLNASGAMPMLTPVSEAPEPLEDMSTGISLLDGLDGSCSQVHLDAVQFSDHIIVTSTENGLIFTGGGVMEGMDDGMELGVGVDCGARMLEQSGQNQMIIFSSQLPDSLISTSAETSDSQTVHILNDAMLSNAANPVYVDENSPQKQVQGQGSNVNKDVDVDVSALEKKLRHSQFERWLASVNERINASMNYRLSGKPEPFVYYVSHELFDILKERITSSRKKKRIPNQTRVVSHRERAPIGNFMKYVWKITNVVHVLQIFQSTLVPLKINQFFVQSSDGGYSEWVPSNDVKEPQAPAQTENEAPAPKIKTIVPVLHSTSLKIGKTDAADKESVPFTIEWIPDVLPQSRHGELTLSFQFSHTGPFHTDHERKSSVAPLKKLIQSQGQGQTVTITLPPSSAS